MHLPSTQEVQVQMKDSLSRVRADVVYGAKAVLQLALPRDLRRDELAIADQLRIPFGRLSNVNDMLLGDDQHVRWRLRIDVFKSEGLFVFVDFLGWYCARDDLAEKAIGHSM